jgi:oligogalacturonide lyase
MNTLQAQWPSERSTYLDPSTGASVTQWTRGSCKNQHLYFTSPSVTSDDRWLTFLSDRTGGPNLFAIDRRSGAIRRLSDNDNGLLRSYVYPLGGLRGLSKASPCLDADRNRLYYVQDDAVCVADLNDPESPPRTICDLPAKWYGGFTHISPDGKTFCIPCTDPRAFADEADSQWKQMQLVPARMKAEHLVTRIYLVDVQTGAARIHAQVPFWVTHVQFDPLGTGRIVFNQEGILPKSGDPVDDRIWCLETDGTYRPLAPQAPGEWRSHENWAPDGKSIVYHGGNGNHAFVAARTWEGSLVHETSLDGMEFWHATGAPDGKRMFVDRRDGIISLVDPWATGNRLVDLCRHDTTYDDQDAHAHPLATPTGRSVTFTSNRIGTCQIYEVPVPTALR